MNKSLRAIYMVCTVLLLTLVVTSSAFAAIEYEDVSTHTEFDQSSPYQLIGTESSGGATYLTVDWDGNISTEPLDADDRLVGDLLAPSPDGMHSLLLEQGTHVPTVGGSTHYLIIIKELLEKPPAPENNVVLVAFNITPSGAEFDRDIVLTLGLDELQLPENAPNIIMAYYDDVIGTWVGLDYETGGPNGVAELTLSAPTSHFSIFGVLAELTPRPAHFVTSGLNIITSGESVTIAANVINDGWQAGTFPVGLKLNGETVETRTVTLGAGTSQQVSFTPLTGLGYGQYEVEVAGLPGEFTVSRSIAWWIIVLVIAAIGLIIWGVVWRRRRAARKG